MEGLPAEEIWKKVSSTNIVDKKLRCVFFVPEAAASAPAPAAADPVNPVNSTFVTKPDTGLGEWFTAFIVSLPCYYLCG